MKKKGNFRRFLSYVRPYGFMVALASLGGIVKFTLPLLAPQVTKHLLDGVFLNAALSSEDKLRETLLWTLSMIAAYFLVWLPMVYVRHYFAGKAGHRSVFDLRCDLFEKVLRMSASFFNRNRSGSIVSRLIGDVAMAQDLVGSALTNVWMDSIALVVTLYFLFRIDLTLTLVALSTFPLYVLLFKRLGGKIKANSRRVQESVSSLSGSLQERIAGSRVIHAFGAEESEQARFEQDSDRLLGMTMRGVRLQSLNQALTGLLTGIAPLIVTLYGGWAVIRGTITIGDLVAVGLYLGPLYMPIQRFAELNVVLSNSLAALDRIFEVMDMPPEIVDRPGASRPSRIAGEVRFDSVAFSYGGGKRVLDDVSFSAESGRKVAIVGPSGSGKTTIVNLIPRFYDVESGRVLIDGLDVRDLALASLRSGIGMVLQEPVLFSGSIAENVLYGAPGAGERRLREACRAANALDFIEGLSDGLNTEIGERGVFLSGGQRQRVTIARAYLKDPRILILDEATSSLDAESEYLIQEALDRLMVGRTTFIVAHRLSTIEKADLILVLQDGRIVETGRHEELFAAGGAYARLYDRQFRDEDEAGGA